MLGVMATLCVPLRQETRGKMMLTDSSSVGRGSPASGVLMLYLHPQRETVLKPRQFNYPSTYMKKIQNSFLELPSAAFICDDHGGPRVKQHANLCVVLYQTSETIY